MLIMSCTLGLVIEKEFIKVIVADELKSFN